MGLLCMKVFRCMGGLGRIATANVPAFRTLAKVQPSRPHLQALFAAVTTGPHVADAIQVRAGRIFYLDSFGVAIVISKPGGPRKGCRIHCVLAAVLGD